MLTVPADRYFSLCVRTRANWTCEHCGKKYEHGAQGLHCAHYFSRGMWSTRFYPANCFSLCFYHHQLFHGNPDYFHEWASKRRDLELLREMAYNLTLAKQIRQTKGKGEIAKHFRDEYERMLQLRSDGNVQWLDFMEYSYLGASALSNEE